MPELINTLKSLNFIRLAGTDGEKKAINFIEKEVKNLGFKVKKHPFKIKTFEHKKATLSCGKTTFEGIAFGCCENSKTTAELIFTENPRVVNLAPEHHRGKILLTYGRPRGLYHELKDSQIAGMVTICPPKKGTQSLSHRQHEINPMPAMTLDYDNASKLADFQGQKVTLKIEQKIISALSYNLEIHIPGTHNDGTITYFVGHYDSVSRSVGACDNAGGSAVLLKLIENWSKNPPLRDTKVIFFSGEELGLLGSQAYCEKNAEEIKKQARLVVNIDVTGDDLGSDEFYITGTKELAGFASGIARMAGGYCNTRLALYSSDSIPFAKLAIPSINLARYGGNASFYGHTPDDSVHFVTHRGLHATYTIAQALADALTQAKIYPVDRKIDDTLRDELEAYIWGLTGLEPHLDWPAKYR